MSELILVIKIGDSPESYQYAQEIENVTVEQLAMLNALIDVAKNNVVAAINEMTKG